MTTKSTEESLSQRLAQIAREVGSRDDVGQASDQIAAAATELLAGAAGAGVTLVYRRRQVETSAATADLVRIGDQLQYELGEGPCLDAAWEHEQVYARDLVDDDRWPRWGRRVVDELGVRSMLCTQLFTDAERLGALNVYAEKPDAFDAEDCEVARLFAAHAAVAVAAAQQIESLKIAVDRRTTIGKALGILMVRYELDDDGAMTVLRRVSSHENRKLYDIALEVIRDHGLPSSG